MLWAGSADSSVDIFIHLASEGMGATRTKAGHREPEYETLKELSVGKTLYVQALFIFVF